MSHEAMTGLFTLGGVAFGGILTLAGERFLYRRQRVDALNDRLYHERSAAYITFLQAAHECAHKVGQLALHPEYGEDRALPMPDEQVSLVHLPDAFAAKHVRVVEVVGPPEVADAATRVQGALYDFRNALQDALVLGAPIEYWGPDYKKEFNPYRNARTAFVEIAKAHLARLSARSDAS
jgi:hypothetical protein